VGLALAAGVPVNWKAVGALFKWIGEVFV
jgi:hypothetical protein